MVYYKRQKSRSNITERIPYVGGRERRKLSLEQYDFFSFENLYMYTATIIAIDGIYTNLRTYVQEYHSVPQEVHHPRHRNDQYVDLKQLLPSMQ
ncbi:MAG: hypothetical protein ACI90V_013649 [Bacillariaceae sp.]|jgi:hypothetical protein